MYNEIVMEHFQNPKNVGEILDADGIGEMGSAQCGDTMVVYIKVKDNVIDDIKFKTYGCCAAIASSSIATEMVKGKTIEEAEKLTKAAIVEKLGGLPEPKIHCSLLAEDAIHAAIHDYKQKRGIQ
jgi:nitrogen fixation NifU-like protein